MINTKHNTKMLATLSTIHLHHTKIPIFNKHEYQQISDTLYPPEKFYLVSSEPQGNHTSGNHH